MKTSTEFCKEFNPCYEGKRFALRYATMAEVWDACPRIDWFLWILKQLKINLDAKALQGFGCWCIKNTPMGHGRMVWDSLIDKRSKNAIEIIERFIRGEVTEEKLMAAIQGARDVYNHYIPDGTIRHDAASASCIAVFYASRATTDSLADVYTVHTAAFALHAAYVYANDVATKDTAEKVQADYLRTLISNPFL